MFYYYELVFQYKSCRISDNENEFVGVFTKTNEQLCKVKLFRSVIVVVIVIVANDLWFVLSP